MPKISNNVNEMFEINSAISSRRLELIIFPTEQCNFRCDYCYEDFAVGKINREKVNAIKILIAKRMEDLQSFRLRWFGGEPLLAKDIVLEICEYAQNQCKLNDVLFEAGDMTTNGYLLDTTLLSSLVRLGQAHFQISLDGNGKVHDSTRKLMSGRGTFDRIWANLKAMHQTDLEFSVTLRLHLGFYNINSQEELIDRIQHEIFPDSRFNIFLRPIENFGGKNADTMQVMDEKTRQHAMDRLNKRLGVESVSDGCRTETDSLDICYAARPNSLMIRADGTIGKCTVLLNDPANSIGRLNDNGTLSIFNEKLRPWVRGFSELNIKELQCPAINFPKIENHSEWSVVNWK